MINQAMQARSNIQAMTRRHIPTSRGMLTMTRRWLASALVITISTLNCAALAAIGDPVAGKRKAAACAGCHGKTGISRSPNYPNLAGQKKAYLVRKIRDYQTGHRRHPLMTPVVVTLTASDIHNLAAYFSSQGCSEAGK